MLLGLSHLTVKNFYVTFMYFYDKKRIMIKYKNQS